MLVVAFMGNVYGLCNSLDDNGRNALLLQLVSDFGDLMIALCLHGRYESIIATLCENLDTLDEPEAKASMIWIIGEYAERIDNADELLEQFLETFPEETSLASLCLCCAMATVCLALQGRGVTALSHCQTYTSLGCAKHCYAT